MNFVSTRPQARTELGISCYSAIDRPVFHNIILSELVLLANKLKHERAGIGFMKARRSISCDLTLVWMVLRAFRVVVLGMEV